MLNKDQLREVEIELGIYPDSKDKEVPTWFGIPGKPTLELRIFLTIAFILSFVPPILLAYLIWCVSK